MAAISRPDMKQKQPILIRNSTLLTMVEPSVRRGHDLLIMEGRIAAIGTSVDSPSGTEVVDATGRIVMPGLVNAHIHLWQAGLRGTAGDWSFMQYFERMLADTGTRMTPADIRLANEIGAWEQIEAGVTTLMDWSHALGGPEHSDAAIEGLEAVDMRAVFGHAPPPDMAKWWFGSPHAHPDDARRIALRLQGHDNISMALAVRGPDFTDDGVLAQDIALARDIGALISAHIGVSRAPDAPGNGVARLEAAGGIGPDVNLAHGNNLDDDEHRRLVEKGATITVAPEIEVQTGMRLPATGAVLRAGGLPSIGTDVTSAYSPDMFGQMRLALQIQRFADQEAAAARGEPHAEPLPARKVVEMATIGGARALRLDHEIGSLEVGKSADILILKPGFGAALTPFNDPYQAVAQQCGPANVDMVISQGVIRKQNGTLVQGPARKTIDGLFRSTKRLMQEAS